MDEHESDEPQLGAAAQAGQWDARYRERDGAMWSGRPNGRLVAEVAALTPRRVLDIGRGADRPAARHSAHRRRCPARPASLSLGGDDPSRAHPRWVLGLGGSEAPPRIGAAEPDRMGTFI